MTPFLHDLRFGFRMLLRNPVLTAVAILTLALGIGANSAIFSVIDAVMLRPLPYPDPQRLVMVWRTNNRPGDPLYNLIANKLARRGMPSTTLVAQWQQMSTSFERLAMYRGWLFTLTGAGEPERVRTLLVSADFFSLLGIVPSSGRAFTKDEQVPGKDLVVLLGEGLWRRRFSGDPAMIGKTIMLDGVGHTVIGVVPASFRTVLPFTFSNADLWAPVSREFTPRQQWSIVTAVGRLKPGVSLRQAQSEMDAVSHRLAELEPRLNQGRGVNLVRLDEDIAGEIRPALLILLAAVACVLLIACANLANLMLARNTAREKEISMRMVLGAGRARLVGQLLTESVLLALVGGLAGLLLSSWLVQWITALHPGNILRATEVRTDFRVFAFALTASVLTGILFGLLPALHFSKPDLAEALKEGGGRSGSSRQRTRWRNVLVTAEVVLALVLLAGAGLLLRSFLLLKAIDPGFHPEKLLITNLMLPRTSYRDPQQQQAFVDQVLERIRALGGVQAAGITNSLPIGGSFSMSGDLRIEGRPESAPRATVFVRTVTAGYFQAVGIPLLKGRLFTAADDRKRESILINDAAARQYWPGEDPIGRRVSCFGERTIIGVVGDVKNFGIQTASGMEVYIPFADNPGPYMGLAVRTAIEPMSLASVVRQQIREVDKNLPLDNLQSMETILAGQVSQPRFNLVLLGSFATLALLLASVGIYGVISYSVTQRTHEIGVRMALGAARGDVILQVLGRGMLFVGGGVVIGLGAALAATRALKTLLFGVPPHDPVTLAGVALLVLLVALVSSYIPARRATRLDPTAALRYE